MKNTAKLFGREIPLTKVGNINKTYLTKEERLLLKQYEEKQKTARKDTIISELERFFSEKK